MAEEKAQVLFGRVVRICRKKLGWSQEKLALETGLDRTYVASVELGRRNISLVNICKLAKSLGTTPATLLNTVEFHSEED